MSFITLKKDSDEEDKDSFNNVQYRPTKFFANFVFRIKNQRKITYKEDSRRKAMEDIFYGTLTNNYFMNFS